MNDYIKNAIKEELQSDSYTLNSGAMNTDFRLNLSFTCWRLNLLAPNDFLKRKSDVQV